ncbi:MAG: protein kinase [Acidobacteria bacterium]|nr:protein kinase [Acidobacteriota bacterium]
MKECKACHICYDDELLNCPKDGQELSTSLPWPLLIDNKYKINTLINRGGMGAVYQATQLELDRAVAIKILLPKLLTDQNAPRRLHREALASARLNHPNIVTVHDYGTLPNGGGYLVMKLLKGYPLSKRLRIEKHLPFELIFNIMFQVCHAIDTAHKAGVVHCDLKPENIFLEEGLEEEFVQILDFGIAKLSEQLVGITLSGTILGTPLYMSPEQLESREVDFRTDIYSLGIILYEMLTGEVPFSGKTPSVIARQHLLAQAVAPSQLRPNITPKLEACVITALSKNIEKRHQSAIQLIEELKEAAQELALVGRVDLDDIPQMVRRSGRFKLRTLSSENTLDSIAVLEHIKSSSTLTDSFSQSTTESGIAIKTEQWSNKLIDTNEVSKNDKQLVLIVDDEVGILLLLQEVIENLGCRTMTAKDGRGALNLIKQVSPDLIISDIMMPDIDGYKLWDILQADKDWSKIPLIFLTARTQRQDKLQALESGVEDYWTKPFDVTEVELRLKHILKRLNQMKLLENKG